MAGEIYDLIAKIYDEIFPLEPEKTEFLIGLFPQKTTKILDVGCATGALALALAEAGYPVTGIDLNSRMIELAREKARQQANPAVFQVLSMVELSRLGPAGGILCLGNTLPHLESELQVSQFFKTVASQLSENGHFVFQLLNYDRILSEKAVSFPVLETREKRFHRRYEFPASGSLLFCIEVEDKGSGTKWADQTSLLPLTRKTLLRILEESGLCLLRTLGTFEGQPSQSSDFSVIYVAQRRPQGHSCYHEP